MKPQRNKRFIVHSYYETELHIFVGTPEWAARGLAALGLDASPLAENIGGVFLASADRAVTAVYFKTRNPLHLTHELIHAALFVLNKQLDISVDFDSSETLCYFVQDMQRKVLARWQ